MADEMGSYSFMPKSLWPNNESTEADVIGFGGFSSVDQGVWHNARPLKTH